MTQEIVDISDILESLIFKTLTELKYKGCCGFDIKIIPTGSTFLTYSCNINRPEDHKSSHYDNITFLLKQIINSINLTVLPSDIKLRLIQKVFNIKYTTYTDNTINVYWYKKLELDYGFYYEQNKI